MKEVATVTEEWQEMLSAMWPLLVAVALGLAVQQALLAIARRVRRRHPEHLRARVARVVAAPAAVAVPLLFLSLAVRGTPMPEAWAARTEHWLGIGGLLCLTWLAVRMVGAVEQRILR